VRIWIYLLLALVGCTTAPSTSSETEVWKLHFLSDSGHRLGMVRVEVTDRLTSHSCIDTPDSETRIGIVLERKGLTNAAIGDQAAVYISDNRFWMDLNLGWCDHNACISGTIDGNEVTGDYSENSVVGYIELGHFYGHKQQ